jgi:biotin operon repressor
MEDNKKAPAVNHKKGKENKKNIIDTEHIANNLTQEKLFRDNVFNTIQKMQSEGLEVEVQYQQSDKFFSAFIIGRKEVS